MPTTTTTTTATTAADLCHCCWRRHCKRRSSWRRYGTDSRFAALFLRLTGCDCSCCVHKCGWVRCCVWCCIVLLLICFNCIEFVIALLCWFAFLFSFYRQVCKLDYFLFEHPLTRLGHALYALSVALSLSLFQRTVLAIVATTSHWKIFPIFLRFRFTSRHWSVSFFMIHFFVCIFFKFFHWLFFTRSPSLTVYCALTFSHTNQRCALSRSISLSFSGGSFDYISFVCAVFDGFGTTAFTGFLSVFLCDFYYFYLLICVCLYISPICFESERRRVSQFHTSLI